MSEQTAKLPAGARTGVVTTDKRDKTRKVVVEYQLRHPKYGKYVKKRTVLHVHDEANESKVGDRVLVMSRGRIVENIGGARKRRLRVEDLLDIFDRQRSADLVDESAAEMVRRLYI